MAQMKYWDGAQYVLVDVGPPVGAEEVVADSDQPPNNPDLWIDTDDNSEIGAPIDGAVASDRYVDVAGDTATGLILASDPAQPLEVSTKQYVDQVVTVSETDPVGVPARDGLMWVKLPPVPRSWDDVAAEFPSWDAVAASGLSWDELAQGIKPSGTE